MSNDILRDLRGFGTVEKWVLTDPEISTSAKALYALICAYAGNKGQSFPSTSLLSHQLSVSRPTLQKSINQLKDKHVISVEQKRSEGRFSHNVYSLLNQPSSTVAKNTDNGKTDDSNSDDSNTGDNEVYTKINSVKNNSVKKNSENSNSVNKVANKNAKPNVIARLKENGVDEELAYEVWDYRKNIAKSQLTDRALSAIINNCMTNNFNLSEALILMMENGWKGFKVEWVQNQRNIQQRSNLTVSKSQAISDHNDMVLAEWKRSKGMM